MLWGSDWVLEVMAFGRSCSTCFSQKQEDSWSLAKRAIEWTSSVQ
jgi:hypothetical protein